MLRTRLFLGLLPLLLILVGTGAYAIKVDRELAGSLSRDLVQNYRAISALLQMRESARLMSSALGDARFGNTLAAQRAFEAQRATFTGLLMHQSTGSVGSPRATLVAALDREFQTFVAGVEPVLRGGGAGSLSEQKSDSSAIYRVLGAIETLSKRDAAAAEQTAARVEQLAATTERILLTAIVGAVILSLFVAWWLAASLLRPIKALTASAVAVGEGDLDRTVPEVSGDELGQLAHAFNAMSAKLRSYREATLAKVLRTQRTMEATLTSAPDPVFVVDRDGTHAVRNPAATLLAAEPDFAGGKFPPVLAEALERVLASGEHYLPTDYGRAIALRVGRDERHYLPRILAIGDKLTEFKGAAVILQDVTKFRLLDDAKTNLVGTVSHELKTPLTSLRMAVYLLLEQKIDGLTATQRELLESARDDADRLLRILDNLLDLARLEAGASTLNRRQVELAPFLEEIARETRGFAEPAGQTLTVTVAPALAGASVMIDPDRLRHVFMNLLTNASKYSPAGGAIALSASAEPGFVRFAVHDQGPGIPADSVARVFDRFYRAPDQEKSGAGLGLAIAREIVVAHGGSIACTSTMGKGTEFHFVVPR
ncbi:MAG: ATP-binding protein [Verrucomicrobia bacterium]|nr:ATP-binding protein [Verrucomicrobiota bacterium]